MEFVKFILKFFLPPQKSLLEQIKELLIKFKAQDLEDKLRGMITASELIMSEVTHILDLEPIDYQSWTSIQSSYQTISNSGE